MKRAERGVEAALTLLREILEEEDWRAEEEITREYHHRRHIRNRYRLFYGVVTTLATLAGLWMGCEVFNQWYWSLKRWRLLADAYACAHQKHEWKRLYHRALKMKRQAHIDPDIRIKQYLHHGVNSDVRYVAL